MDHHCFEESLKDLGLFNLEKKKKKVEPRSLEERASHSPSPISLFCFLKDPITFPYFLLPFCTQQHPTHVCPSVFSCLCHQLPLPSKLWPNCMGTPSRGHLISPSIIPFSSFSSEKHHILFSFSAFLSFLSSSFTSFIACLSPQRGPKATYTIFLSSFLSSQHCDISCADSM